jgi:hypothetical protein
MSNVRYIVQYFQVVPPIPRLLAGSFAALTVACGVLVAFTDDGRGAAALPILVLQAFTASTGFVVPARRGYFDLLIARGHPQTRIAMVQWLLTVLPGLGSWAMLTAVWSLSHGGKNPLLQSGTVIAFLMASTIPWAANVGLWKV